MFWVRIRKMFHVVQLLSDVGVIRVNVNGFLNK